MFRRRSAAVFVLVLGGAMCSDPPLGLQDVKPIWRTELPALGPPAADANSVYLVLRDHRLAAMTRNTGATRWVVPTGEEGSNLVTQNTPVAVGAVVVMGDEVLRGFRASDGALLWTFTGGSSSNRTGIHRFRASGSRIYAGSASGYVFALDGTTGTEIWRSQILSGSDPQIRVAAATNDVVYVCTRVGTFPHEGSVFALSTSDGSVRWSYAAPTSAGAKHAPGDCALSPDNTSAMVAAWDDGRIVALRPSDGQHLWTAPAPVGLTGSHDFRRVVVGPSGAVSSSTVGTGAVIAYDLQTGAELWAYTSADGAATGVLAADDKWAYIPFSNGHLGAFDLQTGARRWLRRVSNAFMFSGPYVSGDTLFLGAWDAAVAIDKR